MICGIKKIYIIINNKMKIIKNNKNIFLIGITLFCIIISIIIYKKEHFQDFTNEVLLEEPLNNIHTIDISTSTDTTILKNIYLTWETSDIDKMPSKMKESIEQVKISLDSDSRWQNRILCPPTKIAFAKIT